jgi:peptidoglycan hydrolase CwlO-like protein
MTIVGKILVFINLVFSLLTAGLIVMVYTTRVNWNKAYNDQAAAAKVAQNNVAIADENAKDEIKKRDAQYQQLKTEKDRAAGEARSFADQLAKSKSDYEELRKSLTNSGQNVADLTGELNRRKNEVETLRKQVDERDKRIAEIDAQMARLRDEAVQFRVQWEQAKEKIGLLQRDVERMARESERTRQQGGGAAPAAAPSGPIAPRVEDLQGTIQRVDGDLATVTPGSDAGVAVGMKLRVFHERPKPEFLGYITILNVTPTQAVGRLSGPLARRVAAGDQVDAR